MPFDEFAVEEFAAAAVAHLQELSWRAVELRAECAIRLGTAPGAVGYLERLVTEQPLRESAWVLLIRALISSGRHCHAAGAAERARTILDQELGTEPRAALWAAADHELARLQARRTVA